MKLPGHELIGDRLIGQLPSTALAKIWTRITSAIVKRGFVIEYRDLESPRTGIFDGLRIVVDPDVNFEMQSFILLHLFGHSVQWVAPSLANRLDDLQYATDKERFLTALRGYEFEAAQLGMQVLHEAGVLDHDQWYSDFVETDWRYVERYYREGDIPPWEECVSQGTEVISPRTIPPLEHRKVDVRFAF